jgi:RimJ/RimL family protein N-acetyltransferase
MKEFVFTDHVVLENERVRLEPLTAAHVAKLKGIIEEDHTLMKFASIKVEDESGLKAYIDDALQKKEDKVRYPFVIFDKLANAYAGSTSYHGLSNKDGRIEIGFTWIGRDFQRTGLNRGMKFLMLQHAFETLDFLRVELRADSRNEQSRKAILQIGATYEGEFRSFVTKPDGYRSNAVCFSILAEEWPQIKKERFAKQEQQASNFIAITNSTLDDIDWIFGQYKIASDFMKARYYVYWPDFERKLVETEIQERRQWKLTIGDNTACIWATTFDDPQIWEEKNADPSVYIHRIATNPDFRGRNLVAEIVSWAKKYAADNGKKYIRMDTVGDNKKLIAHYTGCGFDFLGLKTLKDVSGLPQHYELGPVCLFELAL